MSELQIFNNPDFGDIRIVERDGEPWFVGKDIAQALGYKEPSKAAREKVDPEDRGVSKIDTPSGEQQMTIINESGVYSLIFSSKLEKAQQFKRWVTAEVLPAIRKTGGYLTPAASDSAALESGLKLLSAVSVDYLAPPPDVTDGELKALDSWVKAQRAAYRTVKLVRPFTGEGSDDMGIIQVDEPGLKVLGKAATAASFCARIAGILAGIPMSMSATYTALPEVTAVTERSDAEETKAIDAGKLILIHDGQKAKIARGVNSLVTIPPKGKSDWRYIKIVEGMDLITYYLRTTIEDSYIGRYANIYDNKQLLVAEVLEYLQYLERAGVLNPGQSFCRIDYDRQLNYLKSQGVETADMTEQQVLEYQTDSWVFLRCGGRLANAMEDFEVLFNNL